MALSKNITFKGIQVNDAYIKVLRTECNKTDLAFTIGYKADADSDQFKTERFECSYSIDGNNPIAQAYEHLKTLDEFSDATDA